MKYLKKFFRSVKKDIRNKKAIINAFKFILIFLVCFTLASYVIIPATSGFWHGMGVWHAQTVSVLLPSIFGIKSEVNGNTITVGIQGRPVDFVVTQLCSGDIEIALLVSLLIATLDVLFIWRVLGCIVGVGFLLLINPLRIAITIAITKDSGMESGDFYHSIIFRLFLFVILVFYYFAWYRAFAKRKCPSKEKICKRPVLLRKKKASVL